jgi:hypothetical protein
MRQKMMSSSNSNFNQPKSKNNNRMSYSSNITYENSIKDKILKNTY